MSIANRIPLSLTVLRIALGPVLLILAIGYPNAILFGICLTLAFLSDVFDGIIARRLGIATANLRRLDSVADSIFYVCATLTAWLLYPNVFTEHATALLLLLALELIRYAFDFFKFRRETSYHMWSSKLWGIFLFLGFFSLLSLGQQGAPITIAIYVGIIADLEGLAISSVLTEWRADVPSLFHAFRFRDSRN
jgi:CDP-diacylglycerol--glycerol-3-phosphate 3-phosphatidyltransferase